MLDGYKTWIGIVVTIVGATKLMNYVTPTQVSSLADTITTIVGIVISIYGNYKAHQKIASLQS